MPDFAVAREPSSSRAIVDIIDNNERVFGTLVGPDGLTYVDGETSRQITNPVVAVVTGSRIVFAAMDERDNGGGSLEYADLAAVQIENRRVIFTTSQGVRCEVPLSADEPGVDETCAHLRWVGDIRSTVVAGRNDVGLAVGEIEDHAAAMEWEKAERKYAEMRGVLDDLLVRLDTTPVPYADLAPEITELERTLERAYVRMLVERAESELELADQLLGNGDSAQVGSVLCDAERDIRRARGHAAALERPDSFRFGEQREIFDALDRVTEQIEALASGLLESGHEARRRAATTGNPRTAVDLLETALDCYRNVRDLGLAVDPDEPPSEATIQRLEETLASLREVANTTETQPADESRLEENGSRGQDREAPPEMVTNGPAQSPAIEESAGDGGDQQQSGTPRSDADDSGTRVTDKVINQLTQAIRRSGAETE